MLQRFINRQLPFFARSDHPVMRYTLLREGRRATASARWLRRIFMGFILVVLLIFGYQVASGFGQRTLEETLNPLDKLFLIFYWPMVIIQIGMRLAAFGATTGVIAGEHTRQTWDTLKITTDGAGLALRTRWASVFYQLRIVLFFIVAMRVFFIIVALIDFTSFSGHYIDLLLTGTIPLGRDVNLGFGQIAVGVFIVALQMTAALLAPFTAIALDAALGTLLGVVVRSRWMGILGQVAILLMRLAVSAFALWFGAYALSFQVIGPNGYFTAVAGPDNTLLLGPIRGLVSAFLGVTEGDMGLTLLYLPHTQRMFADLDYGVFIGVAALMYILFQAFMAQLILRVAVRRAGRAEHI